MLQVFILLSLCIVCYCAIETYPLDKFPKDKVALHMPCEESNMFATKCMCHLKCTDLACNNAKQLCEKYEKSKGCKYMLIRGNRNKIATLKRVPTAQELAVFDISMYPNNSDFLSDKKWQQLNSRQSELNKKGPKIKDLVKIMGDKGSSIISKLFDQKMKNPYCGQKYFEGKHANRTAADLATLKETFLNRGIAMTALSYHSPMTLINSMRTWNSSGFLQLMSENHIILNDPLPAEHSMALHYGIKVLQPKDIKNVKVNKPNVVTIGAAFYYALQNINSEYLIFLENDFKMDTSLSVAQIAAELVTAAGMLESGAEIVRLQSRKYQGCGTFKDCQHHGIHLDSVAPRERMRNWFAFYCKESKTDRQRTDKWVSDCFSDPDYRCFTSWDTNWTLNAVMVKKSTMMSKKYNTGENLMKSIAQIGLDQYQKQDGFESVMALSLPWPNWKVPICLSYQGLFIHEEIETST